MKKTFLVLLLVIALVVAADVGLKLMGALHQLDAAARVATGVMATGAPGARGDEATPAAAPAASAVMPVGPGAQMREPFAPEPLSPFDTEAALRDAGDRDPNVAELLNDPDPAVAGAVRDFITRLDSLGGQ